MIRPISQSQLNLISQPGQDQINQLNNTLQRFAAASQQQKQFDIQNERQSRLDQITEAQFKTQQDAAATKQGSAEAQLFKDNAPIIHTVLTEARRLNEQERLPFIQDALKSVPALAQGVDADDVTDISMDRNIDLTGRFLAQSKKTNPVGKSEILADGTTIQSTANGVRVFGPDGAQLQGKAAANAISAARQAKINDAVAASGGKRSAVLNADLKLKPEVEKAVTSSKEEAKLSYRPKIEKAVTNARLVAQQEGQLFDELSQAKAALPALTEAVDELRELATIATSTLGGRVFDVAVKETGFGSTKGATARAKFIAIINNQVLPLLKPTFGGAFSVQEGESLKATMGDPNASPQEKIAQLDAFMAQKMRDIETKEKQLNSGKQAAKEELSEAELAELRQLRALKAQNK